MRQEPTAEQLIAAMQQPSVAILAQTRCEISPQAFCILTMECLWICCSTEDIHTIDSVGRIHLHRGGNGVTWGKRQRPSGSWRFLNQGLLLITFKAGKGYYCRLRRHAFRQVTETLWRLLESEHDIYYEDVIWDASSDVHQNTAEIFIQMWEVRRLTGTLTEE